MEYNEFKNKLSHAKHKRETKVKNSLGSKKAWRWFVKNKKFEKEFSFSEAEFGYIVKRINEHMKNMLIEGKDVPLPHAMGRLEIRKYKTGVEYVDKKDGSGKILKNKYPINWDKTTRLWFEDEEAYKDKILVRSNIPHITFVYYNKKRVRCHNMEYFKFLPCRKLRDRVLHENKEDVFEL